MTPEETQLWKPFLKRISLFKDLSGEDLDRVTALIKPLSLPRGATLYRQGDAADAFYIITSGHVELSTENQGRRSVLGFAGRGDTLGELALLTGEPRPCTAALGTTTELLVLSRKDFARILRENPSVLLQLSRTLSSHLLQETRSGGRVQASRPQLLALVSALDGDAGTLFASALAGSLGEQSRRRILLVDMDPRSGRLAAAFGFRPLPVSEELLSRSNLRDPKFLSKCVQAHASGVGVLTLPPAVLSGRFYRSIFLLMNLFRDHSDLTLLALAPSLDDVEKAILHESDQWLLAADREHRDAFLRLRTELGSLAPQPKRLLEAWLGDDPPDGLPDTSEGDWLRIPAAGPAAAPDPRFRSGVERLARRIARLRVGLALGTGAALGYALIGILKTFERERIPIDAVAGTSMGSLLGGFYALGMSPAEIEALALGVDKAWVAENLFWDLTLPRSGIFSGTTLLRFIRSHFGAREFRDLELPFSCAATDIESGEEVVFRKGRVAEAIRASCGIPIFFQPFHHQGRFLVDGGLVDPVPIRLVSQMGADILIGANLTMPAGARKGAVRSRRKAPPALELIETLRSPNILQVLFQTIYTMEYEIAQSRSSLAHVNIQPDLSAFSWTEMHRAREIIAAGERMAESVLPKIKALLPVFSDSCQVGFHRSHWG